MRRVPSRRFSIAIVVHPLGCLLLLAASGCGGKESTPPAPRASSPPPAQPVAPASGGGSSASAPASPSAPATDAPALWTDALPKANAPFQLNPTEGPPDDALVAEVGQWFARQPQTPMSEMATRSWTMENHVALAKWARENVQENYLTSGKRSQPGDEQAVAFLEQYVKTWSGHPEAIAWRELKVQGGSLLKGGFFDPVVAYAVANTCVVAIGSESRGYVADDDLEAARTAMDQVHHGPAFDRPELAYRSRLMYAHLRSTHASFGEQYASDGVRKAIEALIEAGSAKDLSNERRQILLSFVDFDLRNPPLRSYRHWLFEAIGRAPGFDPWLGRLLIARELIRQGWDARGGGYAHTVTPERMERFHACLLDARTRLIEAWKRHPECSEAAVDLIRVTMAIGGVAGETPRFWFDRAVQAEFDNRAAYENLMRALLPRWGGSHAEMLVLGRECLATKRFDSDVPMWFHEALMRIADESEERGAPFAAPGVFEDYRTMMVGYRDAAKSDEERLECDSQIAAAAYLAGRHDEARKILESLPGPVSVKAFRDCRLSYSAVKRALNLAPSSSAAASDFPHAKGIRAIRWTPNGKGLITAGDEGIARLWNVQSKSLAGELAGHKGVITAEAIAPDGRIMATAGSDGTVRLWTLADRAAKASLAHDWPVLCLAFHPSGKLLAAGGGAGGGGEQGVEGDAAGEIVLWDLETNRRLGTFTGHATAVHTVAFARDGEVLASAARGDEGVSNGEVVLWSVADRSVKRLFKPFQRGVTTLAFSSSGETLAVAGAERRGDRPSTPLCHGFWLIDVHSGEHRKLLPGSFSRVHSLSFCDQDRVLVAAGAGGAIRAYSVETGELLATLAGHGGDIWTAAVTPDETAIASADRYGRVALWPLEKGAWRSQGTVGLSDFLAEGGVARMSYTADGRRLLVTAPRGGCTLWRLEDGFDAATIVPVPPTLECYYGAAISPDGRLVAVAGQNHAEPERQLLLLDGETGNVLRTLGPHGMYASHVQFTPDGRWLATSGADGEAALWRLDTFKRFSWARIGQRRDITALAISPDGSLLAIADRGRSFSVWDLPVRPNRQTKPIAARYEVNGLPATVSSLQFSPDGAVLLAASSEVQLWDVATRKKLLAVGGWTGGFSPDGAMFVAGGGNASPNDAAIFETATGREIVRLIGGHEGKITAVVFSPDNKHVLTGDDAGRIVNWDVATGSESPDYGEPPPPTDPPTNTTIDSTSPPAASNVLVNSIGMDLVRVEPGEFLMGSPAGEAGRTADEVQRRVRITKPFHIGRFEVTQEDYVLVMGVNPCQFAHQGLLKEKVFELDTTHLPVENVTWDQAAEYCRRLSELPREKAAGRSYRLPTEAEWEYACRGGAATAFCYGDTLSSLQANFKGDEPYGSTEKGPNVAQTVMVGSYEPNALGLYDMHGNVWEWCQDWYGPYQEGEAFDPQGASEGAGRVLRGSCFFLGANTARSAQRNKEPPDRHSPNLGFRIVCEVATSSR